MAKLKGAETGGNVENSGDMITSKKKKRLWRQAVRNRARRMRKESEVPAVTVPESGAQSNDGSSEKKKKRKKKKNIVLEQKEDVNAGNANGAEKAKKRKLDDDREDEISVKKTKKSLKEKNRNVLGKNAGEERVKGKKQKIEERTKKAANLTNGDVNRVKKSRSSPERIFKKPDVVSRLDGAHFRYLNEKLYTTSSAEAKAMFDEDVNAFHAYHKGFVQQVEKWPLNPVENVIMDLKSLSGSSSMIIADVGCGDAKIAKALKGTGHRVHSFDLVTLNDDVVVADMAKLPLKSESVDVAVYCLSLMNTNLSQFMCEANRIIKIESVYSFFSLNLFLLSNIEIFIKLTVKANWFKE